jgi:hypothetical protein
VVSDPDDPLLSPDCWLPGMVLGKDVGASVVDGAPDTGTSVGEPFGELVTPVAGADEMGGAVTAVMGELVTPVAGADDMGGAVTAAMGELVEASTGAADTGATVELGGPEHDAVPPQLHETFSWYGPASVLYPSTWMMYEPGCNVLVIVEWRLLLEQAESSLEAIALPLPDANVVADHNLQQWQGMVEYTDRSVRASCWYVR